jgi:hypothetical protein
LTHLLELVTTADLDESALFMAINYLERVWAISSVEPVDYRAVALTCAILALKQDDEEAELDSTVLVLFGEEMARHPTRVKLLQWEFCICDRLGFDLLVVTVDDFIEVYTWGGIVFEGDVHRGRIATQETTDTVYDWLWRFTHAWITEYGTRRFYPSLGAAAIIYCARMYACLRVAWPRALRDVTQYPASAILQCALVLETKCKELYPIETSESMEWFRAGAAMACI